MGSGMGVVTLGTVPGLYRRMKERKFHLFPESHMALQANTPLRPGFQVEFVLGERERNRPQ
jgi:hypothetical protein